jgi:hypothetical protein
MSDPPTLLTLNQAAKLVGKTPKALRYHIQKGTLPYLEKTQEGYKIERSKLLQFFPDSSYIVEKKTEDVRLLRQENQHLKEALAREKQALAREQEINRGLQEQLKQALRMMVL